MTFVLDASVAIKLYVPEEESELALRWIESGADFVAPDIFLVEVAQALLRHSREGRLNSADLFAAVRELGDRIGHPLSSSQLVDRALELAGLLDHRLHDCMYLALAERLGRPVLTADERLVRKVRQRMLAISVVPISDPHP